MQPLGASVARDEVGGQAERPPTSVGENGRGNPETRRGNSTKNDAPPSSAPPNIDVAPPRKRGEAKSKAGKWIEFKPGTKRKDGTRLYYPKYRRWLPGNEKKEWCGPVEGLYAMTEQEKNDYVNEQRSIKARRKQRSKDGRGANKRLA